MKSLRSLLGLSGHQERPSFREAFAAEKAKGLAKRAKAEPKWEIVTKQTYLDGKWVEEKLNGGWEILSTQPVMLAGTTIKQQIVTMRRPNPRYVPQEAGDGDPSAK
jgi:hypothetical protein